MLTPPLPPPADLQVEYLIADVQLLVAAEKLPDGQGVSLTSKHEAVMKKIDQGNDHAAANILGAFGNSLRAFIGSGVIPALDGQEFIDRAEPIIAQPDGT